MSEIVTMNVDQNLVKSIVEKQLVTAMARELEKVPELMGKIVELVLNHKVDKDGKRSSYSSDNQYSWLEWLITQQIQETARQTIRETISEKADLFKAELVRQVEKNKKSLAAAFFDGLLKNVASDWSFKVDVSFKSPRD